jgi:hypothetical protein
MSYSTTTILLCLSLLTVPVLLLGLTDYTGLLFSAYDILCLIVALGHQVSKKGLNIASAKLWCILGYQVYGQIPLVINVGLLGEVYPELTANRLMELMVILGYRFLLLGLCVIPKGRVSDSGGIRLDRSGMLPLWILLAGLAVRLLLRNNLYSTGISEWAWYMSLPFSLTPAGICLALVVYTDRYGKIDFRYRSHLRWALLLAAVTGIIDVSRKDTGAILLPILLFISCRYRPLMPVKFINASKCLWSILLLSALGVLLMGTRAYSWSLENQTSLTAELYRSFEERRANDMLPQLAFVIDTTPEVYPYLWGHTYGALIPLPRTIIPWRAASHSHYVGLQVRGIMEHEYVDYMYKENPLSVSAHLLGEAYANFGWAGAMLFQTILGMLVALYENRLLHGRLSADTLLAPAVFFVLLTQQRGDAAMMYAPILQHYGAAALLLWLMALLYSKKIRTRRIEPIPVGPSAQAQLEHNEYGIQSSRTV